MFPKSYTNLYGYQKGIVACGIAMLLISLLLFVGGVMNFYSLQSIIFSGQTLLKFIASLAVAGCLVAAIGYGNN
jgi:hypothetical protein